MSSRGVQVLNIDHDFDRATAEFCTNLPKIHKRWDDIRASEFLPLNAVGSMRQAFVEWELAIVHALNNEKLSHAEFGYAQDELKIWHNLVVDFEQLADHKKDEAKRASDREIDDELTFPLERISNALNAMRTPFSPDGERGRIYNGILDNIQVALASDIPHWKHHGQAPIDGPMRVKVRDARVAVETVVDLKHSHDSWYDLKSKVNKVCNELKEWRSPIDDRAVPPERVSASQTRGEPSTNRDDYDTIYVQSSPRRRQEEPLRSPTRSTRGTRVTPLYPPDQIEQRLRSNSEIDRRPGRPHDAPSHR